MKRLLPERLRAALRPEATARFEPPADILRASRQRVKIAALLGTAAHALFLAVEGSVLAMSPLERRIDVIQDGLALVMCGTLALIAGFSTLGDRRVLRAALAVQVLLSALISIADPWAAFLRTGHVPGLTWVVPIVILFPLLVPVRPRLTLAVSSLCAATMPAGLAVLASAGLVTVRAGDFVSAILAGVVAVGIGSVAARTVYGAGGQIAAARRVGSYELEELIGRGGAGEVRKARHLLLARPAAVKLILPESLQGEREARDKALERFTREAQVTADLTSPSTVRLYDFGVTDEQSLYYVMELLPGSNLLHFVYQYGALEPRRVVHLLQQACHSLGEAHARGLIHRDVKPSNLFLCSLGRDLDVIKVLDFGLSRPAAQPGVASLTREGAHPGTAGYMAPEQIFGLPISPATDLYALGCVAYWLLAGATPFDAEDSGELLRLHAQVDPPPLSRPGRPAVPARLEALVMRCLAKDPKARPQDADRLREELLASIEGPAWSQSEAKAWWEAHRETRSTPPPAPASPAGAAPARA
jgi:tRNA A-37 threonylcarbamoyl transferase component Bud32